MLKSIVHLIKLSFCKKIIIVSNTLQILSLFEFIHENKSVRGNFNNFIIICTYANKEAYKKIITCYRELIKKNNLILNFQKKKEIQLLYSIYYFRKLLNLKIEEIIIGNYYSYLNRKFASISKKVFVLDDGTNILAKNNLKLLKKSKYFFFSCFDKKIFSKKNNYKKNSFYFLKKKFFIKKKQSNNILILGKDIVNAGFFKEYQYDFLINYIKNKFKNKNIFYFPHPKENSNKLKKKFTNINFINSKYPVEIYFLKMKKPPKTVVSFNSSAIIPLKLFDKKLNVFNILFKIKLRKNHHWAPYLAREREIADYFKLYLSIKTKALKIIN